MFIIEQSFNSVHTCFCTGIFSQQYIYGSQCCAIEWRVVPTAIFYIYNRNKHEVTSGPSHSDLVHGLTRRMLSPKTNIFNGLVSVRDQFLRSDVDHREMYALEFANALSCVAEIWDILEQQQDMQLNVVMNITRAELQMWGRVQVLPRMPAPMLQ
ncbi:uncharacterized protein LOC133740979 [Rosa rugosa]|uniref:uncharacterized protein LOC133740979 n=1 Tax=Rosa rugosa TaxID=74645 RepID=UPI002B40FB6D|nr:uncharacterized protein LOC133740979 [Rosa rugosa]